VQVDPVQLELAVLNLALNARDAMPDGGRIVIRVRNHLLAEGEVAGLPAGEHVEVTVADDGEGMPPEVMQHVFEPFYTTKPLGKGTGLGLAQVYSFATYSRGAATVNSQPGIGTEVTIWLPRSTAAAAHEAEAPVAQPGRRYQGTVLLVEDDGLVRNLTAQALQGMGFAVEVAASAEEAIALARAKPEIDVVLSDIVMPGGQSGVDLARTLRVLRPALAVVLASGYAQALETDVPVIAKPYNVDQVAEVLARHVSARHGQAATS
jgi:CheY-like chemotaxis protein